MELINIGRRIAKGIYTVSGVFIFLAMLAMVILVVLQVVMRYVFNQGFSWSQEAVTYSMIWIVFIGHSMAIKDHEVVKHSFFTDRMPPRIKCMNGIFTDVIMSLFVGIAIYYNAPIVDSYMQIITPGLKIPLGYIQLALTVGGSILIFYLLIDLYDRIRRIIRGPWPPPESQPDKTN